MRVSLTADIAVQLVSLVLIQSAIPLALPISSFQLHVPGSSNYQTKANVYPRHDNATVTAVSSPRSADDTNASLSLSYEETSREGTSLWELCPEIKRSCWSSFSLIGDTDLVSWHEHEERVLHFRDHPIQMQFSVSWWICVLNLEYHGELPCVQWIHCCDLQGGHLRMGCWTTILTVDDESTATGGVCCTWNARGMHTDRYHPWQYTGVLLRSSLSEHHCTVDFHSAIQWVAEALGSFASVKVYAECNDFVDTRQADGGAPGECDELLQLLLFVFSTRMHLHLQSTKWFSVRLHNIDRFTWWSDGCCSNFGTAAHSGRPKDVHFSIQSMSIEQQCWWNARRYFSLDDTSRVLSLSIFGNRCFG